MSHKKTQSEKLFSNEELRATIKKMDSLEMMEKIDQTLKLSKIFNNTQYKGTKRIIRKLTK